MGNGMVDREKAVKALQGAWNYIDVQRRTYSSVFKSKVGAFDDTLAGIQTAIDLLNKSFTPQEIYDAVIEHAQHDKRFKVGDRIDYSFTDVVDILNMELMCKAGDM